MFSKRASELTYSDIEYLINERQEREGYHLDFKVDIGNPDKAKKELSKDISAFANSGGGFLIIGVDKNNQIIGTEETIQNKPIDEWLNQVISTNIEPHVFYFDPKIIHIPDSAKVLVVIHIPESSKKPHIVTEWNNYYLRINDSSKTANHNQIRDMFEISRMRSSELTEYLKKRNIYDENSRNFGWNKNSSQLHCLISSKLNFAVPLVLFSLIPKYPNEEKIKLSFLELYSWLKKKSKGYQPDTSFYLYHCSENREPKIDGIVLKHLNDRKVSSYFEVLLNGYVEAGFSNSFANSYFDDKEKVERIGISLTPIIAYEMMLLGFAKEFYEFSEIYDEVIIQLSFVNMSGHILWSLNQKYQHYYYREPPTNNQHNNFKLLYPISSKSLNDEQIFKIAKEHSEKICLAFGLDQDYCFVDDKLSLSELKHFYL